MVRPGHAAARWSALASAHDDVTSLSPNVTTVLRNFRVELDAAPGTGAGRVYSIIVNGTRFDLCSVINTSRSCTMTGSVTIPVGAELNLSMLVQAGETRVTSVARWGLTIGTS